MKRAALVLLAAGAAAVAAFAATRPDPNAQAAADGCIRDPIAIFKGEAPNWVYVNDKDAPASGPPPPAQTVSGIADAQFEPHLAAHPTPVDDPLTHLSYDFNVNVKPDPAFDVLLGTGNFAGEDEETARIHTERESMFLPAYAWATRGDRLTEVGSWVWDCGHFSGGGERTELHPYRAIWIERNPGGPSPRSARGEAEGDLYVSTEATVAGRSAECAHTAKGAPAAFRACLKGAPDWLSVNGEYGFTVTAPPKPPGATALRVRVVDRGSVNAPSVTVVPSASGAEIGFLVAAAQGRRVIVAKQVFVGWAPVQAAALPVHLRLRFDKLLIRRAMDPSCPQQAPSCPFKNETTLLGQIAPPPGEYELYWDVAGIWGQWQPTVLRAHDGQVFPGRQTVDFYVAAGRPWRLAAHARECDFGVLGSFAGQNVPVWPCPRSKELGHVSGDDYPGSLEAMFRSASASLGTHTTNALVAGSSCPPSNAKGCYAVTYTVTRVRDEAQRAG